MNDVNAKETKMNATKIEALKTKLVAMKKTSDRLDWAEKFCFTLGKVFGLLSLAAWVLALCCQ